MSKKTLRAYVVREQFSIGSAWVRTFIAGSIALVNEDKEFLEATGDPKEYRDCISPDELRVIPRIALEPAVGRELEAYARAQADGIVEAVEAQGLSILRQLDALEAEKAAALERFEVRRAELDHQKALLNHDLGEASERRAEILKAFGIGDQPKARTRRRTKKKSSPKTPSAEPSTPKAPEVEMVSLE